MPEPRQPSPDVAAAVELLGLVHQPTWERWTEGLFHSTPFIDSRASERLDAVAQWLAMRTGDERTAVQAAMANFARVLADLQLTLHHDMEVRGSRYWISRWYQAWEDRPGRAVEEERFTVHVLLVRNLAAELTRAINLVWDRARLADPSVLQGTTLAVIHVGPDHAPYVAAQYSERERNFLEPYPGLAEFPAVLPTRGHGSFGVGQDGVPTVADLQQWIATLNAHHGPGSTEPPRPNALASVPLATRPYSPPAEREEAGRALRVVLAGLAVLSAGGVLIQVLTAPAPWAGGIVGAAVAVMILHRFVWKRRPKLWALGAVAAAIVGGAAIASLLGQSEQKQPLAGTTSTTAPIAPQSGADVSAV